MRVDPALDALIHASMDRDFTRVGALGSPHSTGGKMTTITHDQFVMAQAASVAARHVDLREVFAAAGITIAPPDPPEEMVKLAREICNTVAFKEPYPSQCEAMELAALAALQHAVEVVKGAPWISAGMGHRVVSVGEILRQLGGAQ